MIPLAVVGIAGAFVVVALLRRGLPPDDDWDTAVMSNGSGQIRRHLAWGRAVDQCVSYRRATALHYAAEAGDVECVLLLLRHDANPNARDIDGLSPLHWALLAPTLDPSAIGVLLAAGADPNAKRSGTLETPLHLLLRAVRGGHDEELVAVVTDGLVRAGADINAAAAPDEYSGHGVRPLHVALHNGHILAALLLTRAGADVRAGCSGTTIGDEPRLPLHLAMGLRSRELVQALLDHGANPNEVDGLGQTPLHDAAWLDDVVSAKVLLDVGGDPTILDRDGRTAMDCAERAGSIDLVRLLREVSGE